MSSCFSSQHYSNHVCWFVLSQIGQHACSYPKRPLPLTQQNTKLLGSCSSVMRPMCASPPACCAVLCHAVLCCVQVSLDEAGASPGCAVLNPEGDLIVGRDEAFYFNTLEGRGPCFACEGSISCVSCVCLTQCMQAVYADFSINCCVSCVCLTQC